MEEQLLAQPEEDESIFNMDLPVIRERVAPGVQNAILMIKQKLLDIAISRSVAENFILYLQIFPKDKSKFWNKSNF